MAQDWLELAKTLPCGQSVRAQCCAGDKSMLVSHTQHGYRRHCFRCNNEGEKKFVPHGILRIADIERHKAELAYSTFEPPRLPSDYTLDIPQRAMLWFMQYGISPELAREYKIGYTPKLDRVVLPVYDLQGDLLCVQMRSVDPSVKPKYLNPPGPKVAAAVFMTGKPTGISIIVEDILSSIKVGKVAHSTSMLGTNMTDQRALTIAKYNHTAIMWTDDDKAGMKGRIHGMRQLKLLGLKVYQVKTPDDPKTYNIEAIKEHLRNMKQC